MRTLGLIGGMSWESTVSYYREINEAVKRQLGGLHSARLVLFSVDFHEIEQLQRSGEWEKAGEVLAQAASALERAGAEGLLICANTMHKVAAQVQSAVSIPLLHIADPAAAAIKAAGLTRIGLLGTRFTMEQDFYRERLESHGLKVLIPGEEDRAVVHAVIYDELCLGVVREESRKEFVGIIDRLVGNGAQAIVLGCTEISLLVRPTDAHVPLFDTTALHAADAVRWSLEGGAV
ncbi:aspartate/glutamate racemase family protein [Rhodanobacter sp. B2A1Ga4]|uniref:aspartate/glutamate racemase family protein n=1 Tax=Rhodanobacter sp. B2A1Ga4 TaxID=2778647 RepID=UPI001B361DAF|nr:aspartate/glutamate racemase family protein [Rhodanobacter sp. B2A1Ga4]MBQ4853781.1 aspartate/glutamate racemase family protein [Rhodanobacter sp. B2A1Ga4]